MAEGQASEKIDLSEVMLAMDVVDTLRHQRLIVERELQSEDREAELIEKLRKIYTDQGLAVSDEVIAEGVKAMREERFAYRPPPVGLKTALARLYVNRGRWAKRAMWLLIVTAAVWAGYRYLYVMPTERGRSRLARELNAQVSDQKERIATLKNRISAATGDLEEGPAVGVGRWYCPQPAGSRSGARQSLASVHPAAGGRRKTRAGCRYRPEKPGNLRNEDPAAFGRAKKYHRPGPEGP